MTDLSRLLGHRIIAAFVLTLTLSVGARAGEVADTRPVMGPSALMWSRSPAPLPPAWTFRPNPTAKRAAETPERAELPLDARFDRRWALGWDGAEGESRWLSEPGEQLESEVAFNEALNSLLPAPGNAGLELGAGFYGSQQALSMGWFQSLKENMLLNFSFSSEPDLADVAARGGILIHW